LKVLNTLKLAVHGHAQFARLILLKIMIINTSNQLDVSAGDTVIAIDSA